LGDQRVARIRRASRAAAAALLGLTALAYGCSFVVGQDADQCQIDADCAKFLGTRCVAGGCVPRDAGIDVAVDPSRPCTSSQDCSAIHGANWVCRSQQCEYLGSTECGIVLGNTSADDVLVIGAIVPYGQAYKSAGLPIERVLGLAAEDFQLGGGIPFGNGALRAADGGEPRHSLAIVLCDETNDPSAAAQHLVDLHVPVIFGPAFGDSVLAVLPETADGGVVVVSPYTTADFNGGTTENGLLWRTSPTSDAEAAAMAAVMTQQVIPTVTSARKRAPRVALAWRHDADDIALHDRLLPLLRAPSDAGAGTDADADAGAAAIDDFDYGNPDTPSLDRTGLAVAHFVANVPDVLVVLGKTEGITRILKGLETDTSVAQKPTYLVSHGLQVEEMLTLADAHSDLRKRLLLVAPGDTESNSSTSELLFRYRQLYQDTPAETFGVTQAYDALYVIAYALARVRNVDVSGADVRDGLRAILFGADPQSVDVGPEGIAQAFGAVLDGGALALRGASGLLAFDPTTYTPSSDVQVTCIPAPTPPATSGFSYAGITWHARTSTLDGSLSSSCPQ
jgi:ABC-type branched-subunit amino acid transport system substrate-binding protein